MSVSVTKQELATRYGVSDETIRIRLKNYGFDSRSEYYESEELDFIFHPAMEMRQSGRSKADVIAWTRARWSEYRGEDTAKRSNGSGTSFSEIMEGMFSVLMEQKAHEVGRGMYRAFMKTRTNPQLGEGFIFEAEAIERAKSRTIEGLNDEWHDNVVNSREFPPSHQLKSVNDEYEDMKDEGEGV